MTARAERASAYFSANAAEWDRIRALYLPEDRVEDVLLDLCGAKSIERYLDVGTGTGRLLEVFATRVQRGLTHTSRACAGARAASFFIYERARRGGK